MTPLVSDADFTLYVGDVREVLAGLAAESVHCVVTSPPYWGLRDYGTGLWEGGNTDCDHLAPLGGGFKRSTLEKQRDPAEAAERVVTDRRQQFTDACGKCGARRVDQQLGLEPTPDEYVQNMVAVFREVRRVLRRDGTCWLNIGDSYASGGGTGNQGENGQMASRSVSSARITRPRGGLQGGTATVDVSLGGGRGDGLKPKDLVGIPWRLAFALQADGWYLRSDVIWSKPNPMPESVTDRPTKAHEYLFLLTRSPRYYFDSDAIREDGPSYTRKAGGYIGRDGNNASRFAGKGGFGDSDVTTVGRNKRSVWEIATEPYPDAHFATFPQALVEPCVLAGTSERGCCPVCGAPWERETERAETTSDGRQRPSPPDGIAHRSVALRDPQVRLRGALSYATETTGWRPTCQCAYANLEESQTVEEWHNFRTPVPCTVLDPFMGSGTTALVARRLGRNSIGIELNAEYARLCSDRLKQLSLFAVEAGGG